MTEYTLVITGACGRELIFAVSRLRDGSYHQPGTGAWAKPKGSAASAYSPVKQTGPGAYGVDLPELDPEQDYCILVFDVGTQQLVLSQMIDGSGRQINIPRAGARMGKQAPRNEYHGGFVADIRAGRRVELE